VEGDSGDAEALRAVMKNEGRKKWPGDKFEVVILLGQSAKPLPKKSQDLRLLSKYVLVHAIHEEVFGAHTPLHVIGENHFDSTVALVHQVTSKKSKKDLVNTQAMFARGLVQVLAYPRMQAAIKQMFEDTPGNPALKIFPVGKSFIPPGTCTFADITRTIQEHQQLAGAVCLGVVVGDEIKLGPGPDEEIDLDTGCSIVVIERGTGVLKGAVRPIRNWTPQANAESAEQQSLFCIPSTSRDSTESDVSESQNSASYRRLQETTATQD